MNDEAILSSIITGIITLFFSWGIAKANKSSKITALEKDVKELTTKKTEVSEKLQQTENDLINAKKIVEKYNSVKEKLENSAIIETYSQPVILVGPRFVGKTSLMMQWHAPWNRDELEPTKKNFVAIVPIHDFTVGHRIRHFADPDIESVLHKHLVLKVHDFPGEVTNQKVICDKVKEETILVNKATGKDLGVVLICMLSAEEAIGSVSSETKDYYNGELFKNLRVMVSHGNITISKLIFVFNKYDLLKQHFNGKKDDDLLSLCIEKYSNLFNGLFHGVINEDKKCEIFTILNRDDMFNNNRGANIVLGEAAKHFVTEIAGEETSKKIIQHITTSRFSKQMP